MIPPVPTATSLPETAAGLRLAVGRLARRMRQESSTGLTLTQLGILNTLDRGGRTTLGDLAAAERVAPPTITKAVASLVADGLVEKVTDDADRRIHWARLTPAGRREVQRTRSRREAWLAARLATLDEHDLARLTELLPLLEAITGEDSP
jgi:DNA-binding MarR family transcriptional regulator